MSDRADLTRKLRRDLHEREHGPLARDLDPARLPSKGRRANYWIDMGRGLAQERTTRTRTVGMSRRAGRLAPMLFLGDPYARATVGWLLYEVGGPELRGMARRMGLISS